LNNDTSITPHSPAQGWQEVLNMWISFQCKLGGKVDQFWMQTNTIVQTLVLDLLNAPNTNRWLKSFSTYYPVIDSRSSPIAIIRAKLQLNNRHKP
ncbi:hypothetical protein, partial [Shewanella canadensis]|uniref:hypothetical protein n=1 Tax=Shewanella canadensis TaxID=271096 RepID=UPI001C8CB9C0